MASPQYYGNLLFIGVARVENAQGVIIASHSYNTETSLDGVKQVLEQPNTMGMEAGKHYTFNVGSLSWHLIEG